MTPRKIHHETFKTMLETYMSNHPGMGLYEYNYGCRLDFLGHVDIEDKDGRPHGRMIVQVGAWDGDRETAWNLTHVLADDYGYFTQSALMKCKRDFNVLVSGYANCTYHPLFEKYNFTGLRTVAQQLALLDGEV